MVVAWFGHWQWMLRVQRCSPSLTGALAGLFHVLSGPDHLAAVAPLAVDDRQRGWLAGWTWGIGHASGVVVVAALAVLLRELLPPIDVISAWSERIVGGALIGVGLWALRRSARVRPRRRTRTASVAHDHLHVQAGPGVDAAPRPRARVVLPGRAARRRRQLAFLRRAAGAGAADARAALTYIAAFGVGTVAAMTAVRRRGRVCSACAPATIRVLHRAMMTVAAAAGDCRRRRVAYCATA